MTGNPPLQPIDTAMDAYTDSQDSSSESLLDTSPPTTDSLDAAQELSEIDGSPLPFTGNGDLFETTSSPWDHPTFILVIGGLGYIGSHTVLELLREGYNVIIVDNLSNCYENILHHIKMLIGQHCKSNGTPVPLLHFHRVDYRSRSMRFLLESYSDLVPVQPDDGESRQLMRRSRVAGVIHFAAYKSVAESIGKPLQYYKNNVSGLVSLLHLLDRYSIRNFIFSSSATVYGTKANSGKPLKEEDLVHHPEEHVDKDGNTVVLEPIISGLTCPYARTKYFSEAILADLAVADPSWHIVALRYFNPVGGDPSGLLGENPRSTPTNLYPILGQVLTGSRPELTVFGSDWATRDGTAIRDFVHVLDVARGHIAALRSQVRPAGFRAYNLGSGTGTTVLEAVRSLEAAAERPIPLRWAERRPGDVGTCVASNDRAANELGWFPRETITQCAADQWRSVQRTVGAATPAEHKGAMAV